MSGWLLVLSALGCRVDVDAPGDPPPLDPVYDWSFALEQVVTESGRVDYDRLEAQRDPLERYIAWLRQADTPSHEGARTALWLNARTAFMLYAVLEHDRPTSVRDLPAQGLWLGDPFTTQLQFQLGRDHLSLAQLEHSYLRGRVQDPRLHAALNDALYSSPPLRPVTYMPHAIDQELDQMMRWWLQDPQRGVHVDGDTAVFPAELVEHSGDITRWTPGDDLCSFAASYVDEPLSSELSALSQTGCPHRAAPIDARLNHETRPDRVRHAL